MKKNTLIIGVIAFLLGLFIYFLTTVYQSCPVTTASDFLVNQDTEM